MYTIVYLLCMITIKYINNLYICSRHIKQSMCCIWFIGKTKARSNGFL